MKSMKDPFWDVRAREKAGADLMRDAKAAMTGKIAIAKRLLSLQHQPGYQDYVQAVEALHQHIVNSLVTFQGDNDMMRVQQGRAQALGEMVVLLTRTEQRTAALEKDLAELQNGSTDLLTGRPPEEKS